MSPWVGASLGAGAAVLLWFVSAMAAVLTRVGAAAWVAWVPGAGAWVACRRADLSGWWIVIVAVPIAAGAAVLAAAGAFTETVGDSTTGNLAATAVGGLLLTVGCCAAGALWAVVAFRLGRLLGWSGAATPLAVLAPPIWASLVGWGPRVVDADRPEPQLMMRVWAPPAGGQRSGGTTAMAPALAESAVGPAEPAPGRVAAAGPQVPPVHEVAAPAPRGPESQLTRDAAAPAPRGPEVLLPPPVTPVVVAAPVTSPVVVAPVASPVVVAPVASPVVVAPPAPSTVPAVERVQSSFVVPQSVRPPVVSVAGPFAATPSLPPPPPPVSRPGPESMAWSHPGGATSAPGAEESTRLAPRRREVWWLVTATQRLPLPLGIVSLGRARSGAAASAVAGSSAHGGSAIGLDDPSRTVSKVHAQLRFDGSAWWISDAGSTNGTALVGPGGAETVVPVGRELVVTGRVMLGDLELQIMPAGDE